MSELEQKFRGYLNKHPEIRSTLSSKIINVRALARHFMKEEHISPGQIQAIVAMVRRLEIMPLISDTSNKLFSDVKISIKDEVVILDYDKSKRVIENIKNVIANINYDKNETLKVVVGSHSVKIIVDSSNSSVIKKELGRDRLKKEYRSISETSLLFSSKALDEKGIVAYITSELLQSGINIREIITCTPELIIYFDEEQSLKAYEIFKRIKKNR